MLTYTWFRFIIVEIIFKLLKLHRIQVLSISRFIFVLLYCSDFVIGYMCMVQIISLRSFLDRYTCLDFIRAQLPNIINATL